MSALDNPHLTADFFMDSPLLEILHKIDENFRLVEFRLANVIYYLPQSRTPINRTKYTWNSV